MLSCNWCSLQNLERGTCKWRILRNLELVYFTEIGEHTLNIFRLSKSVGEHGSSSLQDSLCLNVGSKHHARNRNTADN